jgi:uncharacterized membrane protein YdjX (TVP38/TMEM64 family)
MSKGTKLGLTLMGFTAIVLSLYLYKPVTLDEISTVKGLTLYVRSFGTVMPLVAFVITVIQAIVPAVPFFILCLTNGFLMGMTYGILFTLAGTMTGATITFFAARYLGLSFDSHHTRIKQLQRLQKIDGLKGFLVILGLRLMPYFPAPLINLYAGVGRINYFWFFLASAIGKLPFVIGYTVLGYSILHGNNLYYTVAFVLVLMVVPYLMARRSGVVARSRGDNT